jgi:hypothetical protein
MGSKEFNEDWNGKHEILRKGSRISWKEGDWNMTKRNPKTMKGMLKKNTEGRNFK